MDDENIVPEIDISRIIEDRDTDSEIRCKIKAYPLFRRMSILLWDRYTKNYKYSCTSDLCEVLKTPLANITRVIKMMVDFGIVSVKKNGTFFEIRLVNDESGQPMIRKFIKYAWEATPEKNSDSDGQ